MSIEQEDDYLDFRDYVSADRALTVREEDSVTEAVSDAVTKYPAAEDIFRSAVWVIARSPRSGTVLGGSNPERRLLKLLPNSIAKTPGLKVRYYLESHLAVVDWVKFSPYDDSQAVAPAAYVYKR